MLDIKFIRDNIEKVKTAAKNKQVDVDVDRLIKIDEQRRNLLTAIEDLNKQRNTLAKSSKGGKIEKSSIEKGKRIKQELSKKDVDFKKLDKEYSELINAVPNIPSDDTPVGADESGNKVLRQVGKPAKFDFKAKEHWELGKDLDVIDTERAAQVTGARFGYLKGGVALLEFALIQVALEVVTNKKTISEIIKKAKLDLPDKPFIPVVPPVMIRPEVMDRMARLHPTDERYHIESDDLYLVGSAEHTLGPLHMDQTINESDLPIRYVGFSTAFRREAGTYGKDMKGILRVHQFDKVEIESFSLPGTSILEQDLFVAIQEHIMQSLDLPYQVVQICTGDMGGPDARQIDIETWMPGQNNYRETHTADLMTDYQARRLKTKVKYEDGKSEYLHMNDATLIAIGRTIIAIMENNQQADGSIMVPKILQKYMGGLKKIEKKT